MRPTPKNGGDILSRLDYIEKAADRLSGLAGALRFMSRVGNMPNDLLSIDNYRGAVEKIAIIQDESACGVLDAIEAMRDQIKQEAVQ